jgi:hypothetical protein
MENNLMDLNAHLEEILIRQGPSTFAVEVTMESTFENAHQARSSARVHSELRNKMVPVARQMGPHVCREVSL